MSNDFSGSINPNYIVSVMAQERVKLVAQLYKFLSTKGNYPVTPYNIFYKFLISPTSDKYQENINLLKDFITYSKNNDPVKAHEYRMVATIPDGTVWYDSSKGTKNTWTNFQSKTINENHNSRACFMDVLLNELRDSFEMKYSSSTKTNEYRITFRLGDNRYYPLGVLGYSFSTIPL